MTYQVLEIKSAGQALQKVKRPLMIPGVGQVRIRLRAASLNRRDLWIWLGKYANLQFPIILGSDGCGVIEACGPGVTGMLPGLRVVINPSLDWGEDPAAPGPAWRILGMPDDGTFAECITVSASQVHAAPEHLSDTEAAAMPLAALTAWRALRTRGGLQSGEKVLLTGIGGGVAQWMQAFAMASGAQVWVTSGSREKLQRSKTGGVCYNDADWDKQLVNQVPEGFNLVVDSAGGANFPKLLGLIKPGGRLVFFGATQGNVPELALRNAYWRQIDLRGTTMGSPMDFAAMLAFVSENKIRPTLDRVVSWDEAETAFQCLLESQQFGKVVLKINS